MEQIMTSFPIPDGALVTPLHDSFVLFVEERFLLDENRSRPAQESFSILQNEVAPRKGSREVFGEKKIKAGDNIGRLEELKNEIYKDPVTAVYPCLKKEMNSETSAGKEILSNALKLPLTSLKRGKVSGIAEGTGKASDSSEANNGVAMDRIVSFNLGKEETLKSIFSQEASMIDKQNAKTSLVEKVHNDKKVGRDLKKDGGPKGDNRNDMVKEDYDIPKGLKGLNGGTIDPSRQKLNQRVTSYLQDGLEVLHAKEQASFRGEKKSKGNRSNGSSAPELSKESLKVGSSAVPKDNITHDSCFPSKSKGDDMKTHKDLRKGKGIHWKNESRKYLLENPVKDCMKDFKLEVSEKEIHVLSNKSNERSGGKKADFLSASQARVKGDLDGITLAEKGCNSDALPLEVAPVVIKENWVYCDKCHKWRLLPYGTNPDQLPKKWMCSMLDWLPGMNNCSFSEEETTNALNALYQVPIPEIQNNQKSYPDGAASGVPLADIRNLNQNHIDHSFNVAPGDGKKKRGSNSTMKREAFFKSSKNVNQSSLEFSAEKRSGDARLLKMKSKREADQDGSRVSKKVKTERLHYTNEDWYPGGLSTKETKVDIQKYNEHSFPQDLEGVAKHGSVVSAQKPKKLFPKTMVMEEHDKRDISGKKRKLEDWQDSQICSEYLPCNENHFQDNRISLKEETRGVNLGKRRRPGNQSSR
ncbi:hypothetical protein L1049_020391 [Liquidambar formosana]|uniref:CW-type domain-containing protein n=1 Tax=Liquidambar formosana TaxID=63359 RepID=A0AAP0X5Z5_LIQFO